MQCNIVIISVLTCVLQKEKQAVLAGFLARTPHHTEYFGRNHSFVRTVLNNSVPCSLWLRDLVEIQLVDPVYLSVVNQKMDVFVSYCLHK